MTFNRDKRLEKRISEIDKVDTSTLSYQQQLDIIVEYRGLWADLNKINYIK